MTVLQKICSALSIGALILLSAVSAFAQGTVMPSPKYTGFDNNGLIIASGRLCTYAAGTTTPQPTYSDVGLSVANTNPVTLDPAGRATVFLSATSYKFVLRAAGGALTGNTAIDCAATTQLWSQDNISAVPKVAGRLTDTAKRFGTQVNAQSDLAAIRQVGENFLDNPAITARGTITLADAQAMKRGTYAQIGSKYGQPNASATIAAEKALARGLKEEIAAEVPDISSLNAREGKLLEALNAVGKRVALQGNKDPIGFAWVAHNPTTFLAALLDRSPAVKSLVARGLYDFAGSAAKVSPQLIRVAVASLASETPHEGPDASSSDQGNR